MVNAAGLVVEVRKQEGGYVTNLHQAMEDYHVVGVQCKQKVAIQNHAVSFDKHSNQYHVAKDCNRKFLITCNNFIVKKLAVEIQEMHCHQK